MQVNVKYRKIDDRWATYPATLVNVVRVDGEWIAVIHDTEDNVIRTTDASDLEEWQGDTV